MITQPPSSTSTIDSVSETGAAHALWTSLTSASGACVLAWDEQGRYRIVSDECEKLVGMPRSQIERRAVEEILPIDLALLARQLIRETLDQSRVSSEPLYRLILVAGVLYDSYLRVTPDWERGEGRVVILYAQPSRRANSLSTILKHVRSMQSREAALGILAPLSDQELEVFCLIGSGLRDIDIAKALTRSVRTVHGHCRRAMQKLGAERRTQLVRLAVERGMSAVA